MDVIIVAVIAAIETKNVPDVRHFLSSATVTLGGGEIDLNVVSGEGISPLQVAMTNGDISMMDLLLEYKADINMDLGYGSCLYSACVYGDETMVRYLISKGARVNKKDIYGITPLFRICLGKANIHIIKCLLDARATVSIKDKYGISMLSNACLYAEDSNVYKLLIAHGACVNSKDKAGESIIEKMIRDDTCEYNFTSRIKYLLIKGAHMDADKMLALDVVSDNSMYVTLLLHAKANPHAHCGELNCSMLVSSIMQSNERVALSLIRHGADVSAINNKGETPLFTAVGAFGSVSFMKLLLASNADINHTNNKGENVLFNAVLYSGIYGDIDHIHTLYDNGIDYTVDTMGMTVVDRMIHTHDVLSSVRIFVLSDIRKRTLDKLTTTVNTESRRAHTVLPLPIESGHIEMFDIVVGYLYHDIECYDNILYTICEEPVCLAE